MLGRHDGIKARMSAWLLMLVFAVLQTACGGSSPDSVALTVPVSSG